MSSLSAMLAPAQAGDEARIGQKNKITRPFRQAQEGQARHPTGGGARSAHRLGRHFRRHLPARRQEPAPAKAGGAALVLPRRNSAAMSLHLAEIAACAAPGGHAVLLLDQTGWHLSDKLCVPPNITLLPLPPQCPELNPVENIWQFIRDNGLSNRVFSSYRAILDHCCYAWNKLVAQPWIIMSIGFREWAYGF